MCHATTPSHSNELFISSQLLWYTLHWGHSEPELGEDYENDHRWCWWLLWARRVEFSRARVRGSVLHSVRSALVGGLSVNEFSTVGRMSVGTMRMKTKMRRSSRLILTALRSLVAQRKMKSLTGMKRRTTSLVIYYIWESLPLIVCDCTVSCDQLPIELECLDVVIGLICE